MVGVINWDKKHAQKPETTGRRFVFVRKKAVKNALWAHLGWTYPAATTPSQPEGPPAPTNVAPSQPEGPPAPTIKARGAKVARPGGEIYPRIAKTVRNKGALRKRGCTF